MTRERLATPHGLPDSDRLATLNRLRRGAVVALLAGTVAATALLVVARWPQYWVWVAPEQTPMTFVQAALLLLAAAFSALLAATSALDGDRARTRRWAVLALGFGALTADERFAIHERVRDGYLADLGLALPWGAPGDYLLGVAFVAGLLGLPWLWPALRPDPLARRLFVVALTLIAAAVVSDSFDVERLSLAGERLQQSSEEVVEALAAACFAAATCVALLTRLARLEPAADQVPRAAPERAPAPGSSPGWRPGHAAARAGERAGG